MRLRDYMKDQISKKINKYDGSSTLIHNTSIQGAQIV